VGSVTISNFDSREHQIGHPILKNREKQEKQEKRFSNCYEIEHSPVFAIGTPKISGTTLDEVAQCLLFITHPQYHPLGQGRLW
jgi:hypothetical protein